MGLLVVQTSLLEDLGRFCFSPPPAPPPPLFPVEDVVKEAVKASLHIMQLTESVNRAATQVAPGMRDLDVSPTSLRLAGEVSNVDPG